MLSQFYLGTFTCQNQHPVWLTSYCISVPGCHNSHIQIEWFTLAKIGALSLMETKCIRTSCCHVVFSPDHCVRQMFGIRCNEGNSKVDRHTQLIMSWIALICKSECVSGLNVPFSERLATWKFI